MNDPHLKGVHLKTIRVLKRQHECIKELTEALLEIADLRGLDRLRSPALATRRLLEVLEKYKPHTETTT